MANSRECTEVLDAIFAGRDLTDWIKAFQGLTTPWTVVKTAAEAARDPQTDANGFVVQVDDRYSLVRSPAIFDGGRPDLIRAPEHGEHTEEVLLELGRSWDDIAALKESGAVL